MPTRAPSSALSDAERRARFLKACSRLEPLFRAHMERQHLPGVAYGVVVDGELVFTRGLGAREAGGRTPPDADTVYRIASMTKSFAALAIMKLRDTGWLKLDEPAATYVHELGALQYPNADSAPVTVRQLLTMSAGWPQDDPWADRQLYINDGALSRLFGAGVTFSNPPGVVFEYSNYAYFVLGRIISSVSGMPALDYIAREILKPLGMTSTTWQPSTVPPERQAPGYRWEDDQWKPEALLPSGGDVAAFAGISTTVRDLARWVALFQSAWPPRSDPDAGILRRSSLREMQQVGRPYTPGLAVRELGQMPQLNAGGYGFGLSLGHNGRYESVGHGGGVPGFGSHMRWLPAYGVGIIALANVTYATVTTVCIEALDVLVQASGVPARAPQPGAALSAARAQVIRLLGAWDDKLADELFAENFFLDSDKAHWQQRLAGLRKAHGVLRPDGAFEAENSLRGRWRMKGRRGWCDVFITMTPTVPPRVQHMQITAVRPPSPAMRIAAATVAAQTGRPARGALYRVLAGDADRERIGERVQIAALLCGACRIGQVLAGDGAGTARFRLKGAKADAELELTLDTQTGKLRDLVFRPTT